MPAKKNIDSPTTITSKTQLTEKEVFDVFEFAQNASGMYGNVFTPQLVNQRMQDITLNPLAATQVEIDKALTNPKSSEKALIGFSEFFELTNMLYKRMLQYLGNMLAFCPRYVCINADSKDYKTPSFKKDLKIVEEFMDKFNHRKEFKTVIRQLIRQEAFFSILRDEGNKYTLQELPQEYCMITGRSESSLLFDFNMQWFIQPAVDINMYPPIFKQYYNEVFKDGKVPTYSPSADLYGRNGSYTYWHQTSPEDGMWAWKFNSELATRIPFFSPLFSELVLKPQILKLQTNIYILKAQKVMVGLIPLLNKDVKGGSIKDSVAISSELLGKFLGLLKQGLSESIKVGGVPFSDIKEMDFDGTNTDIMDDYTKNTSGMSGINSRLLYATDKMSAEETRNSISVDSYMMEALYPYFANFMDFEVNKRTSKFKFKFEFYGTEFDLDKERRKKQAMEWATTGVVLPQFIAGALDLNPKDLERHLDMANASEFTSKLMSMISMYTQSSKGGAPTKDSGELSESGSQTREDGSNIDKGKGVI